MNKIILMAIIIMGLCVGEALSQSRDYFRYQASLLDSRGEIIAGRKVSILVSVLLENGNQRQRIYTEFHNASTNDFGIVDLKIGQGNPVLNDFIEIDWTMGNHFLRVEMDENGGSNYKQIAETQLLSVPYALHANTAGNVDDADADPENELQTLTVTNNELTISNGNSVLLQENTDNQQLSISGNELTITNGNTITLSSTGSSEDIPDPQLPVPIKYQGQQLYVHPEDNSQSIIFGPFDTTGAISNFDGETNTTAIVNTYGNGTYAAKLCDDLVIFGFSDWYLPSRAELDALYKQNYLIQGYEYDEYWSSTETAGNKSFSLNLSDGQANDETKNMSKRCRCIRKD